MRHTTAWLMGALMLLTTGMAWAEDTMLEDFNNDPQSRWRYVSDQVMGGVSEGAAAFGQDGSRRYLQLTGEVSTANRGGFIQARCDLEGGLPEGTQGIRLVLRGNGARYFLHLRTRATLLPWQYYQAGFIAPETWTEIRIPLGDFAPSGRLLPGAPRAASVRSIGIVAYGQDYTADLSVAEIGTY